MVELPPPNMLRLSVLTLIPTKGYTLLQARATGQVAGKLGTLIWYKKNCGARMAIPHKYFSLEIWPFQC